MISGFVINKFRGDPTLFDDGYRLIEARTSWRGFGVLPYFAGAKQLPAEDALGLADARKPGKHKIAFLALSRIANFDDLDPLKLEPDVDLVMVRPGEAIPGDVNLVILPGTKSTRGDLAFLRAKAGTSIFSPIIAGAAMCLGFAAATRCWDTAWRSAWNRRAGGRNAGSRTSGRDDGDDRAQDPDACCGDPRRNRPVDRGL